MSEENNTPKWYVVHTYSGYENKVMTSLQNMVENMALQDRIVDVRIPTEEVMEVRNDKKRLVQRKLFPGYVMVKMIMDQLTWYAVRNTRGVTGFVGPGSKTPIPLTDEEVRRMGVENVSVRMDIKNGDYVDIINGPLDGISGVVEEVDAARQKVRVIVSMFGRETPVELDFVQVKVV